MSEYEEIEVHCLKNGHYRSIKYQSVFYITTKLAFQFIIKCTFSIQVKQIVIFYH